MTPINPVELLDIWQAGAHQPLIENALRLLASSSRTMSVREAGQLSIGERDLRLLQLREWLFGDRLQNIAYCPRCAGPAEWSSSLEDLRLQSHRAGEIPEIFHYTEDAWQVRFRLPNSADFYPFVPKEASMGKDASMGGGNPKEVLASCIISLEHNAAPCGIDALPETILDALAQRMEQEDPQADIRISLDCPHCGHSWEAPFDIAAYLWAEIDNWARHTLEDIYLLARHFGWSERDILTIPPQRRQIYINMLP